MTFRIFDPKLWVRQLIIIALRSICGFSVIAIIGLCLKLVGIVHEQQPWLRQFDVGSWLSIAIFVAPAALAGARQLKVFWRDSVPQEASISPAPWIATTYELPITPPSTLSRDEQIHAERIDGIIASQYFESVRGPYYIRILREPECGSVNYCVIELLSRRRHLLRFHRRIVSPDDLKRLQEMEIGIARSGIFGVYGESLSPIRPAEPFESNTWFIRTARGTSSPELVAMYPFLEKVTRFEGTEIQLESLAEQYGRLQTVTENQSWKEMSQDRSWLDVDLSKLRPFLDSVQGINSCGSDNPSDPFPLIQQNMALIDSCLDRTLPLVNILHRQSPMRSQLLLHDLHPRNAFFRNGQCILIYDYECMTRASTEPAAAAFALHRFARKMVVDRGMTHRPASVRRSFLMGQIKLFQENYNRGRGMEALTDETFVGVLDSLIMLSNLQKLLYVGRSACFRAHDPGERSPKVLYAELVKYIRCLAEAAEFAP